eukprot:gene7404-839_t
MGGWDEERLRAAGSISSKYQSMEQQQQQASILYKTSKMESVTTFVSNLAKGDAQSWSIVGGVVGTYLLYKQATKPAEDPRPAAKHIAKAS